MLLAVGSKRARRRLVDMTSNEKSLPVPTALTSRGTSVGQDVREYIRHLIMTGTLKEGDRLRVEHLAADLDISVTPVREALVELMGEGFVERRQRRGYAVAKLTRSGFEDRVLVLAMITGELAARAAKLMDSLQVAELKAMQRDLTKLDRDGQRDTADSVNHRLHSAINLAAHSPELAWAAERFSRYWPRYSGQVANSRPRTCSYRHTAIIKALETGDSELARQRMFDHLIESTKLLGDDLAAAGLWSTEAP